MQGSKRISKALTEISVQYKNDEYIAPEVLKDVMVAHESDQYYVYNNDFRIEQTYRANGSPANMATWDVSTSTYNLSEHALKDVITTRDRENVDPPLQLDADTTEYLTDKIQLQQEYLVNKLLFTTTSWGNNTTIVTATSWTYNTTTSNPIAQVLSATGIILSYGSPRPNTIITNFAVESNLKENPNIYGRIQYVEKAILTRDLLASIFDVDRFLVGTATYNQGKEGATVSMTAIWASDVLLGYFDPNPRLKTRTAACMLRLKSFGSPWTVKKWFDEEVDGDYIEVRSFFQPKLIATSAAYFFKSVLTA